MIWIVLIPCYPFPSKMWLHNSTVDWLTSIYYLVSFCYLSSCYYNAVSCLYLPSPFCLALCILFDFFHNWNLHIFSAKLVTSLNVLPPQSSFPLFLYLVRQIITYLGSYSELTTVSYLFLEWFLSYPFLISHFPVPFFFFYKSIYIWTILFTTPTKNISLFSI
jgi:hypothetical protein